MKKIIGKKIGEARMAAGISQHELAKLTGLDQASLISYESGETEPISSNLKRISWALNISTDDLLPPDDFIQKLLE